VIFYDMNISIILTHCLTLYVAESVVGGKNSSSYPRPVFFMKKRVFV